MLLFLVRHGVTPHTGVRLAGWKPGVHLSDEGRRQAERLVERFDGVPIDAIYSSPIDRAVETARPLASARKLRPRIREDLGDVRYGEWEGRPLKALVKTSQFRAIVHRPSTSPRFPGGETLRETYARAVDAVSRIADDHAKQTVAVFAHADIIKMAIAHYAGIHLDQYARLAVAPTSVSAVWAGDGGPRILAVNDTGSLRELVPKKGSA